MGVGGDDQMDSWIRVDGIRIHATPEHASTAGLLGLALAALFYGRRVARSC
jgi:hypothetical protein